MSHFSTLTGLAAYNSFLHTVVSIGIREIHDLAESVFEAAFGMPVYEPQVKLMIAELRHMRTRGIYGTSYDIKGMHEALAVSDFWMKFDAGSLFGNLTLLLNRSKFRRSEYLTMYYLHNENVINAMPKDFVQAWILDLIVGFPVADASTVFARIADNVFTPEELKESLIGMNLFDKAKSIRLEILDFPNQSLLKQALAL